MVKNNKSFLFNDILDLESIFSEDLEHQTLTQTNKHS